MPTGMAFASHYGIIPLLLAVKAVTRRLTAGPGFRKNLIIESPAWVRSPFGSRALKKARPKEASVVFADMEMGQN